MVLRLLMTVFLMGSVFSTSKVFSMTWEGAGLDLWQTFIEGKIASPVLKQQAETYVREKYSQLGEQVDSPRTELGRMIADEKEIRKVLKRGHLPEIESALRKVFAEISPQIHLLMNIAYLQTESDVRSELRKLAAAA